MNNQKWTTLAPFDIEKFDKAEAILHRAAQFLAMVGKNYVSHQKDDSHANLVWAAERSALVTWPIEGGGIQAAFQVAAFQLQLMKNGSVIDSRAIFSRDDRSIVGSYRRGASLI
ncbi:MAG: hypothetical protein AAFZ15_15880 [Bacteroidota bacterium]